MLLQKRAAVVDGRRLPSDAAMRDRAEEVAVLPLHGAFQVERAAAGGIEQPRTGLERKLAGKGDIAPAGEALGAALRSALLELAHAAAHGRLIERMGGVDLGRGARGKDLHALLRADRDAARGARAG